MRIGSMGWLIGLSVAAFAWGCGPGGGSGDPACAALDPSIDHRWLSGRLAELSGAREWVLDGQPVRIEDRYQAANKVLARAWLRREYEALGYSVWEQAYGSGVNLVAERPAPDSDAFVLVGAHYDSIGGPGADDNGSGTVATLAVARALSGCSLKFGLRFLAFDEEELGLIGSRAYVASLVAGGEAGDLIGAIAMDMVAYDYEDRGYFFSVDCDRGQSARLTAGIVDAVERDGLPLVHVPSCALFIENSDHLPFWEAGLPAVFLCESQFASDWSSVKAVNSCYHQPCDTMEQLNLPYMARIATAVARSVALGPMRLP